MKKSLRICSLLLALVTALSCLLTGCGETENPESTSSVTTQAVGPENTDPAETEYDPLANVNIKNLGGETYLLLTPSHDWAVTNLTVDDISGDVIQDTIYSRQLKAEELLSCKFEETVGNAITVVKTASAGAVEDAYCLALAPAYDALSLYKDGYIVDQAKLGSINFDNPWWEESFNADVNVGKGRYVTFSQASLIYYSSFYIFCFNKQMIENNHLENPYDLVKSGDWTWDKAYTMMQTAAIDEGADGVFTAGVDTFGITGHINHSRNIRFSCGYTICEDNDKGSLNYNGLSTAYVEAFEKYTNNFIMSPYAAISGSSSNKYVGYTGEAGIKNYISVFKEGKSLFLTTGTNEVMQIRDAAIEYGVVCVPKYSKDQENYITPVYSATDGFVIPKIGTTENQETAAMIIEVLGALSYQNLVDKHIGLVLHSRVAQDPTAIEMINIAYSSGAVDKAMANNFGTCTSLLNNLDTAGLTTVSSIFKAAESKIKKDIKAAEEAVGIN